MFTRLLYWLGLSITFVFVGYLVLAEGWGDNPAPITKLLLFSQTPNQGEVWLQLGFSIPRFWDLAVAPLIALTLVLHDEKDDFFGTLGFVLFGILAYAFIYLQPGLPYGLWFLILVALAIGMKTTLFVALRVCYTTLVLTFAHTWLFPDYSIGLMMYGAYACVFSGLIFVCQSLRFVFKGLGKFFTARTT